MDRPSSIGGGGEKVTRRSVLKSAGELAALALVGESSLTAASPALETTKPGQALKGLNLGGWLVAERWMTPDLFKGVSGDGERAIGRELGAKEAKARISTHRDQFITEQDFQWISEHGFDFVRLPFGYWLFEEAEGYTPGEKYVSRALEWGEKHNVNVLLDFHGLQGSQNGKDHSGEVGHVGFYDGNNIDRALSTVEKVTNMYGRSSYLLGIEVINEPAVQSDLTPLIDYYEQAYRIVAARTAPEVKVMVSDGFQPERMIRALGKRSFGERLIVDAHLYQLFTDQEKDMTLAEHLNAVSSEWGQLLTSVLGGTALVGEWTAALPNKAVQGQDVKDALRAYYDAQKDLFNRYAWGQSFWSYKAPGSTWWSFRDLQFGS